MASVFPLISPDLFQEFIFRQFSNVKKEDLDSALPLVPMLLVLQFVSRRFRATIMQEKFMAREIIINYRAVRQKTNRIAKSLTYLVARSFGSSSLLEWFSKYLCYPEDRTDASLGAVEGGHILLLDWLKSHSLWSDTIPLSSLVESDSPEVVRWTAVPLTTTVFEEAVYRGKLRLVRWFISQGVKIDTKNLVRNAIGSDSVEMLQLVIEYGGRIDADDLRYYTFGVEMAEYINKRFHIPATNWSIVMLQAANAGRIDTVQYIKDNELCELPTDLASLALADLHVKALRWCLANGYSIDVGVSVKKLLSQSTVYSARWAKMLRYLHELDSEAFMKALREAKTKKRIAVRADVRCAFALDDWRFFASIDLQLPLSFLHVVLFYDSYFALEIVRYLVEECKISLFFPYILSFKHFIRSDVLEYLTKCDFSNCDNK